METRLRIATAIAVVATLVAIGEGIALVTLARRQPEPTPVATDVAFPTLPDTPLAADTSTPPTAPSTAQPASATPDRAETTMAAATDSPATDASAAETRGAAPPAADTVPLTEEELAAQRAAEQKARMTEALALMAESSVDKMLDALKLTEAQRQQAAPIRDKLCVSMLSMMAGPQQRAEALQKKAAEMKDPGGFTDDQIKEALKPEREALYQDILRGPDEMVAVLDELAPILDPLQTQTLNTMKDQIKQSKEQMKTMFDSMEKAKQPPPPPAE